MADYVSKVDIIYPKGNKLPDKVEYRNDDSISDENSSDENENSEDEEMVEDSNIASDLIHIAKNGTKYKYRKAQKSYAILDTIKPRTQKIITENNSCFLCRGVMNKKTCLVLLKHTELITIP